eukprot:TRINITY_DN343_c0_g1_i1.p2 TRINITY_DN343_c0_g1~~TRINITY_DN343_c0_g1_i1.p2  ORF type:complete len:289 (-),score=37.57 TRINITY_DN343_c0_g1_i1:1956-2726(-)
MRTTKYSPARPGEKVDEEVLTGELLGENREIYYKVVAKLKGLYYSIYDGKTEYELGKIMHQKVRSGHKGGYYVYPTVQDAIFADMQLLERIKNRPLHKGGKFLAPRTILKVICWGEFVVYDNNKMSFEHVMPIEDIGLPIGYKYTKSDKNYAIKHSEDWKKRRREKEFSKNIVKSSKKMQEADALKYENYFKTSRPKTAVTPKKPTLQDEFQQEIKGMISQLEKQVAVERKPYDKDIIEEAKKALMNIAGISELDI